MQLEENLKQIGFSILEGPIADTFREQGISVNGPGVGAYEKKIGLLFKPYQFVAVERSASEDGVMKDHFDVLYVKTLPLVPAAILESILGCVGKHYIGHWKEGKFDRNTGEPMDDPAIEILKKLDLYS